MKTITLATLSTVLGLMSASAFGQDAPNPKQVTIKRITYAGNGCGQGTVNQNLSLDARAFTLTFSDYYAEVGPNAPGGRASSQCKIKLDIRVPQGWSYTLFNVDYRGEVFLDEGVQANLKSKYFFQADPGNYVEFNAPIDGYYWDAFQKRDELAFNDLVWSPCGKNRALNMETEVSLSNDQNPNGEGLFDIDSIDGEFSTTFLIQWARCY